MMNDLLVHLWNRANTRVINDYQLSGKPREEWRSIPDMFSEYIVKECIDYLNKRQIEGFDILEERNLKEHFGVE